MTAIYGYNFCTGARKSFVLLTKNAVRAVVLDKVADFVLFIGKLLVVVIVASVTYLLFSNQVRQVKYFIVNNTLHELYFGRVVIFNPEYNDKVKI